MVEGSMCRLHTEEANNLANLSSLTSGFAKIGG